MARHVIEGTLPFLQGGCPLESGGVRTCLDHRQQGFQNGLFGGGEIGEQGVETALAGRGEGRRLAVVANQGRMTQLLKQPVQRPVHQVDKRVGMCHRRGDAFRPQQILPAFAQGGAVLLQGMDSAALHDAHYAAEPGN